MGIPAFYSWLIHKYPNVREIVEENNGLEFDNLYLDMNGIIHRCFNPDHSLVFPPTTFEEVFENVFVYIDRLFSMVKPRKLIYLAIDGVAPRAKMNQQRNRRFRTAKDNEIAEEEEKRLREKYERLGKKLLPVFESQVFDSNVITPGTEFMFKMSNALKSYVIKKLESDPGWKEIKVILSDETVPGEGEHKIMSFIRSLRSLPGYDPNTRHCLYGLDADLIMLALATHEIHFSILREHVSNTPEDKSVSESTLQATIQKAVTIVRALDKSQERDTKLFNIQDKSQSMSILAQQFEFLHVWILREYLEVDMQIVDPPENLVFDLERIVDDFIFICLFMGNDFLPRIPTLEVRENGIGLLMHVYKAEFKNLGGYLVDMERVNEPLVSYIKLERVEKFILSVGSYEDKVFKKRTDLNEIKLKNILSKLAKSRKDGVDEQSSEVCITDDQGPTVSTCVEQHQATVSCTNSISDIKDMFENTKELKQELKNYLSKNSDVFNSGVLSSDKVKLGSVGWKQRYYKAKFSVEDPKESEILRKEIVQKYTEGLCWVLMYYFYGIPSWTWYYSYHYGIFASELKGLAQVKVEFCKGSPFKPFDQLMAVLPPKSAHALPEAYRDLMLSSDSNIIEFYPSEFEVDADGKRWLWQGICKLPFIDQDELFNATSQLETKINMHETKRNVESTDRLFWKGSNSSSEVILDYVVQHTEKKEEFQLDVHEEDPIMCCYFKLPVTSLRAPRLLVGVQLPEKTVFEKDISEAQLWHETNGWFAITRQPVNRCRVPVLQNQRKAASEEQVIHKHAGIGWSAAGRGKGNSFNFSECNHESQTGIGRSSSSATSRGWFKQHPTVLHSSPNVNTSMESLSISPSRPITNGSFWPSRNAPDNSQNPSWRPVSYMRVVGHQNPMWRPASNVTSSDGNGNSPHFTTVGRRRERVCYRYNSDNDRSLPDSNRWEG